MATREQRQKRLQEGCCVVCSQQNLNGKTMCEPCRLRHNEYIRTRRIKFIKKNLCSHCGEKPPKPNMKRCEECHDKRASIDGAYQEYHVNYRKKLKQLVLEHYGEQCACCGENGPVFLTIDHINEDGAEHRKQLCKNSNSGSVCFYRWLKKNDFPDGFQTLCYSCNIGKHRNGGICPHQVGV